MITSVLNHTNGQITDEEIQAAIGQLKRLKRGASWQEIMANHCEGRFEL